MPEEMKSAEHEGQDAEHAAPEKYGAYDEGEHLHESALSSPEILPQTLLWSAYEHEHIQRGSDWYWALGAVAISAAVMSILFSNVLFAVLILLAATTIGMIARMPPELHEFEINDKGIRIGEAFHPFSSMLSFWVDEELEKPLLLVDTTAYMTPNLVIPLGDMSPQAIREALQPFVEETPMKEPLAHKILEFFGF